VKSEGSFVAPFSSVSQLGHQPANKCESEERTMLELLENAGENAHATMVELLTES